MRIDQVLPGDIVRCEVKGRSFYALVEGRPYEEGLPVEPITRGITYKHVTARQVTEHFRKMGRPR